MTDTSAPAVPPDFPLPSFVDQILRALAQKGLTALAAFLTTYGVIQTSQQAMLESLGLSAVAWVASFVWTWVHERQVSRTTKAALNKAAPVPPVPATP